MEISMLNAARNSTNAQFAGRNKGSTRSTASPSPSSRRPLTAAASLLLLTLGFIVLGGPKGCNDLFKAQKVEQKADDPLSFRGEMVVRGTMENHQVHATIPLDQVKNLARELLRQNNVVPMDIKLQFEVNTSGRAQAMNFADEMGGLIPAEQMRFSPRISKVVREFMWQKAKFGPDTKLEDVQFPTFKNQGEVDDLNTAFAAEFGDLKGFNFRVKSATTHPYPRQN